MADLRITVPSPEGFGRFCVFLTFLTVLLHTVSCVYQGKFEQASVSALILIYLRLTRIQEKVEALKS